MNDVTKTGAVEMPHPYEDYDPKRLALEIAVQGEAYAEAKRRSSYLSKMKEPLVARLTMAERAKQPSLSISAAKTVVLASDEYSQYIKELTDAEHKAAFHYARREAARYLCDGERTKEATRRQALYGRG
jgi:hypothetical protein